VVEAERAYLAMEFVDGAALDKFCSINRLLPMHRVIGIIFKCCLALDYAFRQGIVHRDIKPANILLDANDNPKITDFGLALNLQKDMGTDSTFVMGVGSPAYMSPEQVKNYPLNHKTDLYSLGVLLFQLLTGRLPFRANNPATLVYKIVNMDTPSVCALNPNLPPGLDPIIRKALEKDLYSRYRNGAEFAKDLSSVRYQMLQEDQVQQDQTHFERLRKLHFFADFEDIELWEVLRISSWRELAEKVTLISEGDHHRKFGVIVEGFVEVSAQGRVICRLGPSEVVGEMAFLHPSDCRVKQRWSRSNRPVPRDQQLCPRSEFGRSARALQQGAARQAARTPARSQQGARQTGSDGGPRQLFGRPPWPESAARAAVKRRHGLSATLTCEASASS
jgi:serine/threonine protein kinase